MSIKYTDDHKPLTTIEYNGEGEITRQTTNTYDDHGNRIKFLSEAHKAKRIDYYQHQTYKYNEHNDCIEMNWFNKDGSLKKTSSFSYKYDNEGNKITEASPFVPPEEDQVEGETVEIEKDSPFQCRDPVADTFLHNARSH